MHVMISFEDRSLRRADFDALRVCGVYAEWSEDYAIQKERHDSGMILGYGDLSEDEIAEGVARLRAALDHSVRA
jgi:GntR family transcriptional regulator/MocR family aminotransferase